MTMDEKEGKQEQAGAPRADGLVAIFRRIVASSLMLFHLRVELFSTEFEAEKLRLIAALVQALLALMLLAAGLGMFSFCLLLVVPDAWRWLAALGLGVAYLCIAYWSFCRARVNLSPPGGAFGATLAELKRDSSAMER